MKAVIVCLAVVLSAGACKKTSGGPGGGGGGTSWLVGKSGLMVKVGINGDAAGYDLASTETLTGIACRFVGEAWVVGTHGTLLYTTDGGQSWQPQQIPTTADLRALATQNTGPVYVAGDGVFLTSVDAGAHWTSVGDGTASFRSLAAAQYGDTVLAISDDGTLWSYENQQLVRRTSIPGARTVAVSPDGESAIIVGDSLIARSVDAGRTWTPLSVGAGVRFDDVRLDEDGDALAVGASGAIAHIGVDGRVTVQHAGTADLHTVHLSYLDDDSGVGFTAGDGGAVWITRDGGATWQAGPVVGGTVWSLDQIGDPSGHR
jgi:photosystem II stability/assembly factor-like uncharacterized protein